MNLEPRTSAALLVLAMRRTGRMLGDAPGHEFHGNQWTASLSSLNALHDSIKDHPGRLPNPSQSATGAYVKKLERLYDSISAHLSAHPLDDAYEQNRLGRALKEAQKFLVKRDPDQIDLDHALGNMHTILAALSYQKPARYLASVNRDHTPLHAAADKHLSAMTLAVAYGFMRGRKAYKSGGIDASVKAIKAALLVSLPPVLEKAYATGGTVALGRLPKVRVAAKKDPIAISFDAVDRNAVAWAKEHAAELADGLSATSEQDIKDAVARAVGGDGIDAAYDDILAAVGDEARAEMIARTEVMWAANEGQQGSWDEAVDAGLLPPDVQVVWIATSGCCDDCDALDGETRDLNGKYDDPDAADGPPLHPNCRCTEGIAS